MGNGPPQLTQYKCHGFLIYKYNFINIGIHTRTHTHIHIYIYMRYIFIYIYGSRHLHDISLYIYINTHIDRIHVQNMDSIYIILFHFFARALGKTHAQEI